MKTDFKQKLTDDQYNVCFNKATEPPFSGKHVSNKEPGMYRCVACDTVLFSSETKYDSGSGWPSFYDVLDHAKVKLEDDTNYGMVRTEVTCATCGAHLGHVFDDGPKDTTGLRYCINSLSLDFQPKS